MVKMLIKDFILLLVCVALLIYARVGVIYEFVENLVKKPEQLNREHEFKGFTIGEDT
jgi:hypothetical protein